MEIGQDSLGRVYLNIDDMWDEETKNKEVWYRKANEYWSKQTSDLPGVLGGLPEIHPADISGSSSFLFRVLSRHPIPLERALDCGCGIGRVTKYFLQNHFAQVDLLDQCSNYINQARLELPDTKFTFFTQGLQEYYPVPNHYNLIWIQWVLSHLTDSDLISFFTRIISGLKPGGIVIIKENIKKSGFMVHKDDYSVTRSEPILKSLISQCFNIIDEQFQGNFPENLYKVKMFACVPK